MATLSDAQKKQKIWDTLGKMTPTEQKLLEHLIEFQFLYHKSDDKGKFPPRAIRHFVSWGVIELQHGDAHEPDFYQLTDLYDDYAYIIRNS